MYFQHQQTSTLNVGLIAHIVLATVIKTALCIGNNHYKTVTMAQKSTGSCAPELDYPFLQDPGTINYIKRSKVMFIIRGLPGSGKSHLAKEIVQTYNDSIVCSADDFRPPDMKYPFPKEILTKSHSRCQEIVEKAAKDNTSVIVVDNSNLKYWAIQPYLTVAQEYNYTEVVVEPKTKWKWNPVELAARSTQVGDSD